MKGGSGVVNGLCRERTKEVCELCSYAVYCIKEDETIFVFLQWRYKWSSVWNTRMRGWICSIRILVQRTNTAAIPRFPPAAHTHTSGSELFILHQVLLSSVCLGVLRGILNSSRLLLLLFHLVVLFLCELGCVVCACVCSFCCILCSVSGTSLHSTAVSFLCAAGLAPHDEHSICLVDSSFGLLPSTHCLEFWIVFFCSSLCSACLIPSPPPWPLSFLSEAALCVWCAAVCCALSLALLVHRCVSLSLTQPLKEVIPPHIACSFRQDHHFSPNGEIFPLTHKPLHVQRAFQHLFVLREYGVRLRLC